METKKSLRRQLVEMQEGESLVVPLDDYGYSTIRSYASDLGFLLKRRYSANRNRKDRTYTITRHF